MRGDRIRHLRKSKGLSQEVLAERIGVTKEHMNRLETGRYDNPTARTLEHLADTLECSVDYLLGRSDAPYQLWIGPPKAIHPE